jgi:hypothetical protein
VKLEEEEEEEEERRETGRSIPELNFPELAAR